MFALARQFTLLIGADGNLEVPDCAGSYNRKTGDYNGYDGGFVVNVSCLPRFRSLPFAVSVGLLTVQFPVCAVQLVR